MRSQASCYLDTTFRVETPSKAHNTLESAQACRQYVATALLHVPMARATTPIRLKPSSDVLVVSIGVNVRFLAMKIWQGRKAHSNRT